MRSSVWIMLAATIGWLGGCRHRAVPISELDGPGINPADRGADHSRDRGADHSRDRRVTDLPPPTDSARLTGCADGAREGFVDLGAHPRIAGCAGGFRVPGVLSPTLQPQCDRQAGNGSSNPSGIACGVEDLCAPGWHVCASAADVVAHSATGCGGAAPTPGLFFVTRQSSTGCSSCATGKNLANPPCWGNSCVAGCAQTDVTSNDVFGCGSVGDAPYAGTTCMPLDRFGNDLCGALPSSWTCGSDGTREALSVIHLDSTGGGVLCCQDGAP